MKGGRALALLLAGACAGPGGSPPAPHTGYHGVIVAPGGDTLHVSFTPRWAAAEGPGQVFAGAPAGGGWTAFGRRAGDSLWWGLARIEGDAGTALAFAGRVEPDGSVRGCEDPARGGRWRPADGGGGAFVLRPRGAPPPTAADAPVGDCSAGRFP